MVKTPRTPHEDVSGEISLEQIGGRTLRVGRWRLDKPSDHPPILFFNGIGANLEAVAPLAEAFTDRGFIIFDMPGTGGSPDPVMPYNAFSMSWTASRLLENFGIEQVDVMGVSWGGAMAQQFALQHQGMVRKLVLIATTAGMLMVPGNPKALSKMADVRRYVDADYMKKHFETLYGGRVDASDAKQHHVGRITPPSMRGYLYQLIAMMGWTSAPALPFLNRETLIMMGDDDQIVPPVNGKFLKTLIPKSELAIIEGGGHLFMLTHKKESLEIMREFLNRASPAETKIAA